MLLKVTNSQIVQCCCLQRAHRLCSVAGCSELKDCTPLLVAANSQTVHCCWLQGTHRLYTVAGYSELTDCSVAGYSGSQTERCCWLQRTHRHYTVAVCSELTDCTLFVVAAKTECTNASVCARDNGGCFVNGTNGQDTCFCISGYQLDSNNDCQLEG